MCIRDSIKGIFVNLRGGKLLVTVIAVFHTEKLVGGIAVDLSLIHI